MPASAPNARRAWTAAWLGGAGLGIANGVARETLYKDWVGDEAAQWLSTASLAALLTGYFWALDRRWPLATTNDAVAVGSTWSVLTVAFEFVFGHYVDHKSWRDLAENYDVTKGRVWILIPAGMVIGPPAVRLARLQRG